MRYPAAAVNIPETSYTRAHELLRSACERTGVSPPRPLPDGSPADWADRLLDGPFAPRGTPWYTAASEALWSAWEAAQQVESGSAGAEAVLMEYLREVRELARSHGTRVCGCPPGRPMRLDPPSGRNFCAQCHLKRAAAA